MATVLKPEPGYDWRCQRCGHQWRSRHPNAPTPTSCSKCRSAYWQKPRQGKGKGKGEVVIGVDLAKPGGDKSVAVEVLLPPPHLRQTEPAIVTDVWEIEEESEGGESNGTEHEREPDSN